ncbi:peptide chain release factor N(5)-glutamine methyltransferase [Aquabacter cavernae]|uniref:peptide chain release factor N(5)-glutamine methyltransferase n=1 Tax=Aquabacter cavernae TaxID=2496029 RepID=UPI000F8EB5EC|nr:peptide chain release factor N(5)-glutamine methyltransferase [Aquabacter cavernae]
MADRLRAAGVPGADLDARLLFAFALGLPANGLPGDAIVAESEAASAEALLARRMAGEPVARILGEKEFWSLPFSLAPETLVPRPDTETVVEEALHLLPDRAAPLRILDLGTGSGAILAALLVEYPHAFGVGVDRSEGAARAARDNLARLGLGTRSLVATGDWGSALSGPFDLVVSNPPYIPSSHIAALDVDVRAHDPLAALDGGADGLDAYAAIARALPSLLAPGAVAVLELGIGQEAAVADLLRMAGLQLPGPARRDLGGIARALSARRP